jgi:hypothetical protein
MKRVKITFNVGEPIIHGDATGCWSEGTFLVVAFQHDQERILYPASTIQRVYIKELSPTMDTFGGATLSPMLAHTATPAPIFVPQAANPAVGTQQG